MDLAEAETEENKDRINIMQEHLKNVQQEQVYTQSRVRIVSPLYVYTRINLTPAVLVRKNKKKKPKKTKNDTVACCLVVVVPITQYKTHALTFCPFFIITT